MLFLGSRTVKIGLLDIFSSRIQSSKFRIIDFGTGFSGGNLIPSTVYIYIYIYVYMYDCLYASLFVNVPKSAASNLKISDVIAREFSTQFYKQLSHGVPVKSAYNKTQLIVAGSSSLGSI